MPAETSPAGEDLILSPDADTTVIELGPRSRPGLCCRELDGEAVLYDVAHHTLHYLNATALFILKRCNGQRSLEDIAAELAEQHGLEASNPGIRTQVLGDVRQGLAELAANGLLEPAEGVLQ